MGKHRCCQTTTKGKESTVPRDAELRKNRDAKYTVRQTRHKSVDGIAVHFRSYGIVRT